MIEPAAPVDAMSTMHYTRHGSRLIDDAEQATRQQRSSRGTFIKWLRRVHGWVGLWGAVLGLLFGVTGILQNHRAMLKIPTGAPVVSTIRLPMPDPVPKSPRELAKYLQEALKLDRPALRAVR